MQTAICVASVWCRRRKSRQRKKKVAIDFCLFVLYSFQQILRQTKTDSFFFNIPRNESAGLLWLQQSSHTQCTILIAALCAVLLLLFFTCLGHLLTTTRHCRHSLDIFTLSKIRTFHTVDTCNTPVTWHWRALNLAENVANSRLWLRKSIYLWCVTVRQCSQHSR